MALPTSSPVSEVQSTGRPVVTPPEGQVRAQPLRHMLTQPSLRFITNDDGVVWVTDTFIGLDRTVRAWFTLPHAKLFLYGWDLTLTTKPGGTGLPIKRSRIEFPADCNVAEFTSHLKIGRFKVLRGETQDGALFLTVPDALNKEVRQRIQLRAPWVSPTDAESSPLGAPVSSGELFAPSRSVQVRQGIGSHHPYLTPF